MEGGRGGRVQEVSMGRALVAFVRETGGIDGARDVVADSRTQTAQPPRVRRLCRGLACGFDYAVRMKSSTKVNRVRDSMKARPRMRKS
jgi:hypothetical protein